MSGDRSDARTRRGSPPGAELFAATAGPAPGNRTAMLDLDGLSIAFAGMDAAWHAGFLDRYRPWSRDAAGPGAATLTLACTRGEAPWFISPPEKGIVEINPLWIAVDPEPDKPGHWSVRACTYCLAAAFSTSGGTGRAVLGSEPFEPIERAVENIMRVATAWLAVTRGGVLVHGASIVKGGKAYLFFGQSGAGKSTLAALSQRGQVVTDDLTLVLPDDDGRPCVVGSPFRGTWGGGSPVQGRYPLAAAFRLRKSGPGQPTRLEAAPRAAMMADAVANVPFVVDQLHLAGGLFDAVERLLGSFPIQVLRFRRDDDAWWDAIEGAGL